ncbi:nucleotidyltransferase family protein [Candidatus Fermentibacteria bacterium]|nr:nucleotidyltransferase family protein [Candidatus Fermentibacteria bacterium]
MRIEAIILAAGESSRMGSPKALITKEDTTLLQQASAPFRALGVHLLVVTGYHAGEVEAGAAVLQASVIRNVAPGRGMASSVRTGIRRAAEADVVFVHPVDCPGVLPATLQMLLGALEGFPNAHAAVPMYLGRGGHPVALDRVACGMMMARRQLTLRDLLGWLGPAVVRVETGDAAVVRDIDTPEDAAVWRIQA